MASGVFGGGNGSSSNPYLIEDIRDLNAIRFFPGSCFKLTQSINAGVYPYNVDNGWLPISNFRGTLDGDGHKIFNLYINRPTKDHVGLFEQIKKVNNVDLRIINLEISNAKIIGNNNVGILAGSIDVQETIAAQSSYFIDQCKFTGSINGANQLGGVIGQWYWTGTLAWTALFVHNVISKVNISVKSAGANYSGLLGYGNFARGAVKVSHFLSDSSFDRRVNGVDTTLNPSHWGTTVTNGYSNESSYYNKESWIYGVVSAGFDLSVLSQKTLSDYDKQIDSNNKMIWNFRKNERMPELNLFLTKKHFIKTSQGYYIYDFDKKDWVKKFDKIFTREQLMKDAMSNVENVPFQAWLKLKDLLAGETCKLLNIVEDSKGTIYEEKVVDMNIDNTHTAPVDKKIFSKKISFFDLEGHKNYGDTIVQIDKSIIR